MKSGTNTTFFMRPSKIPNGNKGTYVFLVSYMRPLKNNNNRVRFSIGGCRLTFDGSITTVPVTLTTVKANLNSTISAPNSKCMTLDIKEYFYDAPMDDY